MIDPISGSPPVAELKYDFSPSEGGDDSHAHQLRAVPHGSNVLEVGCATGYVSRLLVSARGCRVTGIERSPEAAERARTACARVIVGDVEALDLVAELGMERFDVVLLGDVLEHLVDPGAVLVKLASYLVPTGRVVATVPNVAHGDLRLALLDGRFDYAPLGLLDETHLRFFTYKSLRGLFERAGYAITALERIRAPLFGTELDVHPAMFPAELIQFVARDPEATTYQFVVVAMRARLAPPAVTTPEAALLEARAAFALALAHHDTTRAELAEMTAVCEARARELAASADRAAALARELAALQARWEVTSREAEERLVALTAAGQGRHDLQSQHHDLALRYARMRRASLLNPFVVVPALYRRIVAGSRS